MWTADGMAVSWESPERIALLLTVCSMRMSRMIRNKDCVTDTNEKERRMVFEFARMIRKYPIGDPVTVLLDGKPERIHINGYRFQNATWDVDTDEEGIFLLSRLEILEVKQDRPASIRDILLNLKNEVCTKYCRFFWCYEEEEDLLEQRCHKCPIHKIIEEIGGRP